MKHVRKHVQKFASGRASGYGAAYTLPVFLTVASISLWVNATHLQWLGLNHVFILAKLVLLLGVHELLRPFCLSFGDVCTLTAHVGAAANAAVLQFIKRGLHPKFPEWTLWYEWFQAIAFAAGQHNGSHILKLPNAPRFFVEFASRLLTQVQSQLRAAWGGTEPSMDVQILLANYRKLPEVCFPTPLDDAMVMFDYLVKHEKISPENIILAGDSAGGGLVLATLLRLRRARREMPLAALCNCPYADLSADVAVSEHCFISKSMLDAIRDFCVQETPRASWCEGAMLQTDLRGLPPLCIQAAEFDILHKQSMHLAKNARSDGVQVELDVNEHMPHVFTLFPHFMMPQSSVGIKKLAAFITRQLTAHRIPVQLPGAAPAI
ncbi:hypothetical protein JG688_00017462 [Phytophthora aleatoria]|uniref:Alpha/beta hydrolase fold-3 domain-containing protein n=1 Tax=Phytophthora aleatoria TaxID=2496075 RepID=A0A8J5IAG4_9STRA|nr:hypothetical protein JG688_00017462 [Phytophthora aleatoria]